MKNKLMIVSASLADTYILHKEVENIKLALFFYKNSADSKQHLITAENCRRLGIEFDFINLYSVYDKIQRTTLKGINKKDNSFYLENILYLIASKYIAYNLDIETIIFNNQLSEMSYTHYNKSKIDDILLDSVSLDLQTETHFISKMDINKGIQNGYNLINSCDCLEDSFHCGVCFHCLQRKDYLNSFDTTVYKG